jgi:molecular chaperone DnaK
MRIGIDLGTTYSAVAAVRDGTAEIIDCQDGRLTPSAVFFDDDRPVVGMSAKNMAAVSPEDYVDLVKRRMGMSGPVHIDEKGREYRPEEISAIILSHLASQAGLSLDGEVREAVITVPAYFGDAARKATRDAAEIAGLRPLRVLNEPTAAGIAYGLLRRETGTFMVYDLGGGTFDVTVMRVDGVELEVVATDGNRALGGFDFDNILITYAALEIIATGGPELRDGGQGEARLRAACEDAKRRLSQLDRAVIRVAGPDRLHQVPITRRRFEEITAGLLARTEDISESVLGQSNLGWADIDKVLLVGGSSRMPMVADMLQRLTGRRPSMDINPDEAVALGAALLADQIEPEEEVETVGPATGAFRDITSHGMGIAALDDRGVRSNTVVIPRNTPIPCKRLRDFYTSRANQAEVRFELTEGDSEDIDEVEVTVLDMIALPPDLPAESPLRVGMGFDADATMYIGLFDVTNDRFLGEYQLNRPENMSREAKEESRRTLRELEIGNE